LSESILVCIRRIEGDALEDPLVTLQSRSRAAPGTDRALCGRGAVVKCIDSKELFADRDEVKLFLTLH